MINLRDIPNLEIWECLKFIILLTFQASQKQRGDHRHTDDLEILTLGFKRNCCLFTFVRETELCSVVLIQSIIKKYKSMCWRVPDIKRAKGGIPYEV